MPHANLTEQRMSLFSSLFLFLFFSLLHHQFFTPLASAMHPDIIVDTCNRCKTGDPNVNYTLCVASLASVPKSHRSDLQELAVISVKLAKANMTHVKKEVSKLLKNKPLERYLKSCLETCRDVYSTSIIDLRSSIEAIKADQYEDAKTWMSSAVDAPGTCEDSFQEGGIISPIAVENDELFQLTVIALAITSLLG